MSTRRYSPPHKMYSLEKEEAHDGFEEFDVIRFYAKTDIINPIYAKGNKFDHRIAKW